MHWVTKLHLSIVIIFFSILFADLKLEKIADGFNKPIYIKSIGINDKFIFVVEQDGIIQLLKNKIKMKKPFLDISDRVHQTFYPGDERGLLGFALHPDFDKNGYFYVNYINQDGSTIISKFISKDMVAVKKSESIIMEIEQPYSNHNGGHIDFGPDGYLYISVGDGGSAGDPENRAQRLDNLYGKILRIDIDAKSPYQIPKDNPFFNDVDSKKEIWSYGLRNVWRFSFDKLNGDMYLGDVGQNAYEEIDYEKAGGDGGINYGWKIMEGLHCYEADKCDDRGLMPPIYEYPNNANYIKTLIGINQKDRNGCSVTGGYVYRGSINEKLYGKYIFGDYCTGKVWSFIYDNGVLKDFKNHTKSIMNSIDQKSFYLSSFGQNIDGELFLIDYNGSIYLLVD